MSLESFSSGNDEKKKWEKILTSEGMPEELNSASEEFSAGMIQVWNEIRRHYVEREGADWGAHRQKLQEIKQNIKSYELTPEEEALVDEDLLRTVEDEISTIENEAVGVAQKISGERPQIVMRSNAFEGQILGELGKAHPDFESTILIVIAHRVAEQAQSRIAA